MNELRNTWRDKVRNGSRAVVVQIETTRPAGKPEFDLMSRLATVVEDYMAGALDGDPEDES